MASALEAYAETTRLWRLGKTTAMIADCMGCWYSTAYKRMRKLGLPENTPLMQRQASVARRQQHMRESPGAFLVQWRKIS